MGGPHVGQVLYWRQCSGCGVVTGEPVSAFSGVHRRSRSSELEPALNDQHHTNALGVEARCGTYCRHEESSLRPGS